MTIAMTSAVRLYKDKMQTIKTGCQRDGITDSAFNKLHEGAMSKAKDMLREKLVFNEIDDEKIAELTSQLEELRKQYQDLNQAHQLAAEGKRKERELMMQIKKREEQSAEKQKIMEKKIENLREQMLKQEKEARERIENQIDVLLEKMKEEHAQRFAEKEEENERLRMLLSDNEEKQMEIQQALNDVQATNRRMTENSDKSWCVVA